MRDTDLSAETRLQLAPGLRTRLDAAGHVLVDAPDGTIINLGPKGFATLSMFARPLSLGAVIERLEDGSNGSNDLVPTMSVINMLIEEGALVPLDVGSRRDEGMGRSCGARAHASRRPADE